VERTRTKSALYFFKKETPGLKTNYWLNKNKANGRERRREGSPLDSLAKLTEYNSGWDVDRTGWVACESQGRSAFWEGCRYCIEIERLRSGTGHPSAAGLNFQLWLAVDDGLLGRDAVDLRYGRRPPPYSAYIAVPWKVK
jgi:hypothetical protein